MRTYKKFPKIIGYLEREKEATPSSIATYIKSDIRTTNDMLSTLSDSKIDLVNCKTLSTKKRTFRLYSLKRRRQ